MKITQLHGISSLQAGSFLLSGSTDRVYQLGVAEVEQFIGAMHFPLPDFDVVLLPFCMDRVNGAYVVGDGIAVAETNTVYIGAISLVDFVSKEAGIESCFKTVAHEIGHMVHFNGMPPLFYGPVTGPWAVFEQVHGYTAPNNTYDTAYHEAFAESWRMIFVPGYRYIPHRQNRDWTIPGLAEWMLSLSNAIAVKIGHNKAYHNGEVFPLDVAPILSNGRTFVPVRFVSERLGAYVEWNEEAQTVTIWKNNNCIVLTIGSCNITVNGEVRLTDASPFVLNDRTMVPLRFVSEFLGHSVDFYEETQSVVIF